MTPTRDPDPSGTSYACVLSANPLAVRSGLALMATAAPLVRLSADQRGMAELVLAEVLNNIAEHAYGGDTGKIAVELRLTDAGLRCQITDDGIAMPEGVLPAGDHPAQRPGDQHGGRPVDQSVDRPLRDLRLEDLPEGGFGWHLIRRLTQDLTYARVEGQNRLSFLIPG